jgi:hypothetical protein
VLVQRFERTTWVRNGHAQRQGLNGVGAAIGWIGQTLTSTELDLASGGGYSVESRDTLLKMFDDNVRSSRDAIAAARDSDYEVPWSLKMKEAVLFTLPRGAVVRQHISHLSHHRGQMTVYLRLLDVPVPSIYGPTADEAWQG